MLRGKNELFLVKNKFSVLAAVNLFVCLRSVIRSTSSFPFHDVFIYTYLIYFCITSKLAVYRIFPMFGSLKMYLLSCNISLML